MEEGFEDFDYDPFDWSDFEEDATDEEGGDGAIDDGNEITADSVETSTIESANSTSEDTQEQSSTVEEQEANTNTINETEAELEDYGTPIDLSWISTSDLSEEEKNDSHIGDNASEMETKAESAKEETKAESAQEETSQYPNGMTQEEFNAMYEFALGMTGRSEDRNIDDNGNPTGYWGSFEELPTTIEELAQNVEAWEQRVEQASPEDREVFESRLETAKSELADAESQLSVLNEFIDNYQNLYSPIDDTKENEALSIALTAQADARTAANQAIEDRQIAYANLVSALEKAGMNSNLSAEELLSMHGTKFELSKDAKSYASKAADAIAKAISQRDFKGGEFSLPVDKSAKEHGNYLIVLSPVSREISTYTAIVFAPRGDIISLGHVTAPSAMTNGSWFFKDEDDKTIASGESTSAFAQSVSKALSSVTIADYENSKSTSSIPDEVRAAAQAVIDAKDTLAKADKEVEKANSAVSKAMHSSAKETQQDILDKYSSGQINAYQAAVALTKVEDSMIDLNYNSIESAINIGSDFGPLAGNTGRGTVGIDSLISDLMPASKENPASATNISKEITLEFKNLNELKDTLAKVDTSAAKDLQSFHDLKTQVENINTQLDQLASSTFLDLAKELLGKGIELADLDKQPEMQQLNNEIYAIAQMVLDKASELKEISEQYGLNNLSMKDLKGNKDNPTARGYYSAQVALITGKNGVELLDKQDMKALVKYSKSLDATIDSAKALMTAAAVLHGAKDVQGGKYAQAWKAEKAESKLTAKEWFATAATSTLSLFATIVGFAMMPANPLVGGALAFAGTKSLVEKTGKTVGKQTTAHLTNYERMFGSQDKQGASIIANIYDRGFNQTNYGDVKSVGTYTSVAGATIDALNAMAMLTNPITAVAGLGYIYSAGKSMTYDLAKGSYEGKKSNLVTNVWQLVDNIEEWADTNLNAQELADLLNASETTDLFDVGESRERKEGEAAGSDYGTTEGEAEDNADRTYSGASEQAKNTNLAKDYNAGMEKEINEAVSDKYVKVFKVMIDKEPDYIRKVLIAIPKMHSEHEWN